MAKGKKKKKDLDFQKVKLKVGRRLKRDDNETKAEFKSRKIILKEVKNYSIDPISALSRHSDHISQHGKITLLNHFNSALNRDSIESVNKPILDSLAKFILDHSDSVRAASIKCLKNCYNLMRSQHIPAKEFMQCLKPYLDCAYTHVANGIVVDCQRFLEYFVKINDPQVFECIMGVILRRYEAGSVTNSCQNLAVELRRLYLRYKQKSAIDELLSENNIKPVRWTETAFHLDLDHYIHKLGIYSCDQDPEREVLLNPIQKVENVAEKYLKTIK